jgi:hypothetical protein
MKTIQVNDVRALMEGMRSEVPKFAEVALTNLSKYIKEAVTEDYNTRVQHSFFPLRHPTTKEPISKMEPKDIAKSIDTFVEGLRAVVYIPQGTLADQEGRRQELFGGKPWQKIRGDMQDLNKINEILPTIGLGGFKAKTVV